MNNYIDYHTRKRQLWLALMGRRTRKLLYVLFGSRNQNGISQEELAYKLSDCAAAIVVGVSIYGILEHLK